MLPELTYEDFLLTKIKLAEQDGFEPYLHLFNPMLKGHQKAICEWAIRGGRRGIFAKFGLGKTFMQLTIAQQVVHHTRKPFFIAVPLGARHEFYLDADKLDLQVRYVRNDEEAIVAWKDGINILLSNYERIRMGSFVPGLFGGCSLDEASVLRSLDSQISDHIQNKFTVIPYRFVCTATPSPNEYTELLNYSQFLGIMDRGQALTRFFKRDSTTAGNLQLFPAREQEFWLWFRSWGLMVTRPSLLGFSDEGYDLPELEVIYHEVSLSDRGDITDRDGRPILFTNTTGSLIEQHKEKRDSVSVRVQKAAEIIAQAPDDHYLIWHHREDERREIEKVIPGVVSVYGTQDMDQREDYLVGFGAGKYPRLSTKPEIAGSGGNYQRFCHRAIFVGIDDRFNDFIQALHRILRFMQLHRVTVDIIHTDAERPVLQRMLAKWDRHKEMERQQEDLILTYGLNDAFVQESMARTLGVERIEIKGENYTCVRNDNVYELRDHIEKNSVGMIATSIPFGDQYEYSESYHDMGHNFGNAGFFEQLNYSTHHQFEVLQPGRINAVHVKDRIRYGYHTGIGFIKLEDFSGQTVRHYESHGFHLIGKITVTTDVVSENKQTNRLGWSEKCKDGTKMGCGTPEYILLFRKPPTDNSNSYADHPVQKTKREYTRARWQLDAHAYWKSDGNRLIDPVELKKMDISQVQKLWQWQQQQQGYSYEHHVQLSEILDEMGKLSSTFMAVPPDSDNDAVWTDVSRMHTLNSSQARRKLEKHICPLQFDIVDRLIVRYSNPGDLVLDPFGGLMTVPYRAIQLGRKGYGIELNKISFNDGWKYCRDAENLKNVPTLFDALGNI